jgi:hypothetical protein
MVLRTIGDTPIHHLKKYRHKERKKLKNYKTIGQENNRSVQKNSQNCHNIKSDG